MTLNTEVAIQGEVDRRDVFNEVRRLLGAEAATFTDKEPGWADNGHRTLSNDPGQGFPAWLWIHYNPGGPYRTQEQAEAHDDCEDDCDGSWHSPACWLELHLDTTYGYSEGGYGCGDLHAAIVYKLGQWLDERGVEWGWQNEFTGDWHFGDERYDRLTDLTRGGKEANAWFADSVAPVLAAAGANLA